MLDEKTIYNYIDAGLLSVGNIDLPRKVRYRVRKKKKPVRVDKQCHEGRTYEDFQDFIAANPDVAIVEMDSVEGRKGGKVFLTIYFRTCSLMLAYIRDHNTARSVTEVFNRLYELLGHEVFTTLFPVIQTEALCQNYRRNEGIIRGISDLMVDVLTSSKEKMVIGGEERSTNVVKGRFMKLTRFHIEDVLDNWNKLSEPPINPRQYLLAMLYNVSTTADAQFKAVINRDARSNFRTAEETNNTETDEYMEG